MCEPVHPQASFLLSPETNNVALKYPCGWVALAGDSTKMKAVLFVDDHEVLARLSCEILETQGYRAVSAYNGPDALEKFGRESFDIVVTDFRMEGMNGLELAKRIHASHPGIPVIIVTGYGPVDTGRDANVCLQKEQMFPALLEKIKIYLGDCQPAVARH